ncbi:hypothetical protein GPJ56_001565 [Histomonas meleagridis]|uniref:uncharacterized protein n=1 Tax=Histomonas meleagridis TaxID=135588 RepID=UPI0035595EC6|nr:hypothetical protein GPJ56_001565 [Histomonas meleagridis]KAH0807071.1 hypothetical protein GO595_000247 [Histomonas meleagridis]
MTQELHELYTLTLSQNIPDEQRYAISQKLLQIYKEPNALFPLIEIITLSPNNTIRLSAVLGLKKCLNNTWKMVLETDAKEQIKAKFFDLLQRESDLNIGFNIINAYEIVLQTETKCWENLFNFIQQLPKLNQNLDALQLTMYLIGSLPRWMPEEITANFFPTYMTFANEAFQSNNQERIGCACEMTGILIGFIPANTISITLEPFKYMLEVFKNSLFTENYNLICQVANSLNDAVSGNSLPIVPEQVLEALLSILTTPGISVDKYIHIFNPIMALIHRFGEHLSMATATLIQTVITVVATVSNGLFYEYNSDASYIASTIEEAADNLKDPNFYEILKQCSQMATTEPLLLAYAIVFFFAIEKLSEDILANITEVLNIVFQWLGNPSLQLREVALLCINDIGGILTEEQSDVSITLINNLLPFISCNVYELSKASLIALITILGETPISSDIIQPIITSLFAVIFNENPEIKQLHPLAIESLSDCVIDAEEDIIPFVQQIFPLLSQAANSNDPILKTQAIPAIGMLLRFAPNELDSVFEQTLQLILLSGRTDDLEMRNSVMFSVGNLIIGQFPILMKYKENIIELVDTFFTQDLFTETNDEPEDEEGYFPASINGLTSILLLIKWIFKCYPTLAPEDPTKWLNVPIVCMSFPYQELQLNAISAGMYGAVFANDFVPFLEGLVPLFDSDDAKVVAKCFKSIKFLIIRKMEIPEQFLNASLQKAFLSIEHKLKFQKNSEWGAPESQKLFDFFMAVLTCLPNVFPFTKFIDKGKMLLTKNYKFFELAQYINVLTTAYKMFHSQMQPLSKKFFLNIIKSSVAKYLEIYTGENDDVKPFYANPSPIDAISTILEFDEESVLDQIQQLLQFTEKAFSSQYNGETYYHSTIAHSIVFLCAIIRKHNDQFNQYIAPILSKLPLKSEFQLAEFIYSTLIQNINVQNPVVQQMAPEILRVFAQTLGVKNREFGLFGFSQQTEQGIVNLTRQIVSAIPNANEVVTSLFTNQQSLNRFTQKIQ